jgi:hypothetical protein
MKVAGIILRESNRFIHDVVYNPASTHECFSLTQDFSSWPYEYVAMSLGNHHLAQSAARIIFLHQRTQALLASVINLLSDELVYGQGGKLGKVMRLEEIDVQAVRPSNLTEAQRYYCLATLFDIFYCTPNQGFATDPKNDHPKSCRQYRLCPWCRYMKVHQMFDTFLPLLDKDREICVTHFMSPCKSEDFGLNSTEESYEKVARSIRDQRDWIGDYLITLPCHVFPLALGESDGYRLVWRTSLIAVTNRDQWMKPPENLSPKKINGSTFLSDGVVYRYPAHKEGLRDAFSLVTGYPKWMTSKTLTNELLADILTVLLAGDRNRAVPHGFRETEPATGPTVVQTVSGQDQAAQ